jgi:hypothetical protein
MVSITDDAANSPQTVSLTGTGLQPAVKFSTNKLVSPTQLIFNASASRTVTLTNTGNYVLDITQIAVTGDFTQTNNCGKSVAAGAGCSINVTFTPTAKGLRQGTLSVTDDAPGSPHKVALTGTGTYVQLTPTRVDFGTQPVGTRSLLRTITLTNKGDGAVNMVSISITGLNAGDFSRTNNCGTTVASGTSCFIKVTFKPLAKGSRTATVSVSDDGGGSPQTAGVKGTGT